MTKIIYLLFIFLLSVHSKVDLKGFEVFEIDISIPSASIQLVPNFQFAFKIVCNPTTGYDWFIENQEEIRSSPILTIFNLKENNSGEYEQKENPKRMTGVGGFSYFKFRTNSSGKEIVKLVYKKTWEDKPIKVIKVTLDVISMKDSL